MYGECMYSSVLLPRPSLYRYRVLPPKSNPRLDIGTGTFPHRIFASSCSSSPPPSTHHFPSWSWIIISLFFSVGVVFFFVSFSFSCFIFSAFFPFIFWLLFLLIFPCSCSPRVFGLGRWINVTCSLPSAVSLRLSPSLSLFFFPLLPFPSPSIFLPLFFFLLEISLKFYHDSAQSSTSHPVGELWISSTSFSHFLWSDYGLWSSLLPSPSLGSYCHLRIPTYLPTSCLSLPICLTESSTGGSLVVVLVVSANSWQSSVHIDWFLWPFLVWLSLPILCDSSVHNPKPAFLNYPLSTTSTSYSSSIVRVFRPSKEQPPK